ncbi:MAG: ribonuclease Y [Candidatus Cloacimonetes bacterium]|nr:ribonuclease Y [Candidatus Cloacimonadota bacterium]MCF7814598.1 ribonuclease Y [Candidatus Cloacimonadota bacterium]MCF7869078.1 ribonuclease Y [Candidatus Cloacimonadota bacterium]MCF7884495.1 ribonuclease Y [Candidatus Cloacimonadota bacterium]
MHTYIYAGAAFVTGILLMLIISFIKKSVSDKNILKSTELAKKIIDDAKVEVENQKKAATLQAKEEWFKIQKGYEDEINNRKKEIYSLEKEYNERVAKLDKRLENLDRKENNLQDFEKKIKIQEVEIKQKKIELDELIEKQNQKLTEIAKLSREEAVQILKNNLKNKARNEAAKEIRKIAEQTKAEANKLAASILSTAIQRMSVDYVSESTVSVVSLPDDEMKGRIIGREGRNIRAFEKASGIDLIIDDTPEAVVLSGFDPVRREIARLSLEKLISDGRIHPGRIEQVIEKTAKEMDETLVKIGEKACMETNIHNISSNIVKMIGRLKYRTSYGQNILQHSIEAAWLCGIMASELGLDQELARRAGFLHDLGKAIDHEFDGSHAKLGANVARKNGESKIIINAIEAHHEEVEYQSVYAVLTQISDAISGARPGARREMLETYMKRLSKMEEIANSIDGVNKSFAIQAGRELRIIVDPVSIDDKKTAYIASDIADKIEAEMQYPGQIKVMVIRETRQTAVAK